MIEWVHVAGYKCLRDVAVDVGPFNVLIGRNDTGKSSFLEALHARADHALSRRGGPLLARHFQRDGRQATIEFQMAGQRLTVSSNNGWPVLSAEQLGLLARISQPLSIDPQRIASVSERGSGALDTLIATRGQGTAAHFAALALQDRETFDRAEAMLREATGRRVRNIVVKEQGNDYALHYRLIDGSIIPAADASQGILVYTCFLAIVHRDDPPSVLLVEEPENGVHPLRLKEIVDLLRSLTTRGVQIFLTTHSPDLLSWCKAEEVLVFWRPDPDSGTSIHRLPPDFTERVAMGDSIGQIWAARGEEGLLDLLGEARPFVREPAP